MPLISTRGAASAQGFGEFAQSAAVNYIEDVFSTYLYTGNGSTQTITNGIDLSGKGGLVWVKQRNSSSQHILNSTGMSTTEHLRSNDVGYYGGVTTTFNANGFTTSVSVSPETYVSWTFRNQAKFFDVVTWTGNGSNRTISHNLGSVPGCIIVKRLGTADWQVYHRSLANTEYLVLNSTAAKATGTTRWNSTTPTSTEFSLGTDTTVNANGGTYVAYLYAHNAGGFGLSGTDNVISCGSFTTDGSGNATVSLGYEPQWLLLKRTDAAEIWQLYDNMRGLTYASTGDARLIPNLANAEFLVNCANLTATGFVVQAGFELAPDATYIYIAIRRGPMKVPTSGTSVFSPIAYSGANGAAQNINAGFPVDADIIKIRNDGTRDPLNHARLMGGVFLKTDATSAEASFSDNIVSFSAGQNVIGLPVTGGGTNEINGASTSNYVAWAFRRAPGFMDVVCYTGTSSNRTVAHNLSVVPELIFVKGRSQAGTYWVVRNASLASGNILYLSLDYASTENSNVFTTTAPTASVFSVGTNDSSNASGQTLVAYLFATLAGVSKVGSYTGSGTTKQIDCGFTGGARFVLIKRTDSTGDWYVYDSARGIVAGNDPYLLLNSTAAEVASTDYVDTYSAGFELSSTAPAGLNANGGTYIFLAIA